jgi:hypothetical protein
VDKEPAERGKELAFPHENTAHRVRHQRPGGTPDVFGGLTALRAVFAIHLGTKIGARSKV